MSKLRLRDETTYLRKKSKTKYCIIQKLLESQKVIQDEIRCKTFNTINEIHAEQKAKSLFLIPKKVTPNATLPPTISNSNSFDILSNGSENIIESNNVLPTDVIHVDIYADKILKTRSSKPRTQEKVTPNIKEIKKNIEV